MDFSRTFVPEKLEYGSKVPLLKKLNYSFGAINIIKVCIYIQINDGLVILS